MKDIIIDPKVSAEHLKEKSVGFIREFKDFAVKGNAVEMAVGIVIGAAFGKIVSSIVSDIVMPIVGKLTGNVDFANLFFVLGEGSYKTLAEAKAAGVATINYGVFINTVIDFIIVAFAIFLVIRAMHRLRKKEAAAPAPATAPAAPPADVQLLTEIRDLLKK
jgi:large conductance mechanosensitive channel